ncbi:MAG: transposase [Acidimicrobiales bacterium]
MPAVTDDRPRLGQRRGRYPKEFRRDDAALVPGRLWTIADIAMELDHAEQTVGHRVRQERIDRGMSERRNELTRLRRGVRRPSVEPELLKPAVALCLNESDGCRYRWIDSERAAGFPVAAPCRHKLRAVSVTGPALACRD